MTVSSLRAAARAGLFLILTGGLLPFYLLSYGLGKRARRVFAFPFFRGCVALTGLRIKVIGTPVKDQGALLVSNHVSYLDIPVLAALLDGRFVAKTEVRGWPLFGFLARISGTVFVARRATGMLSERREVAERLAQGETIFLFPEGSSSDGTKVLPFRSGLLSAVLADEAAETLVQPVSLIYRPALGYVWHGDMNLAPHLWRVFGRAKPSVVEVRFHPPRPSSAFSNRRDLTAWAEDAVAQALPAQPSGICKISPKRKDVTATPT
ncbi:MAG: hypothetical protein A2516_09580 [Alphaproteobacteria bacterium RIFOXYD12_FULL_60_8]|nr:MAG: hypothetical protein A2516_09580 [Alphaproteobacteria bacterium RIFOXYD12_FULL_60_8]